MVHLACRLRRSRISKRPKKILVSFCTYSSAISLSSGIEHVKQNPGLEVVTVFLTLFRPSFEDSVKTMNARLADQFQLDVSG